VHPHCRTAARRPRRQGDLDLRTTFDEKDLERRGNVWYQREIRATGNPLGGQASQSWTSRQTPRHRWSLLLQTTLGTSADKPKAGTVRAAARSLKRLRLTPIKTVTHRQIRHRPDTAQTDTAQARQPKALTARKLSKPAAKRSEQNPRKPAQAAPKGPLRKKVERHAGRQVDQPSEPRAGRGINTPPMTNSRQAEQPPMTTDVRRSRAIHARVHRLRLLRALRITLSLR